MACLWSKARLAIKEFLFLVLKRGKQRDKSEFVTEFVGIITTINFA